MESSDFDLKERDNSLGVPLSSKQSASGTDSLGKRNSMNDKSAGPFSYLELQAMAASTRELSPTDYS